MSATMMPFPETWEEYEKFFGFNDTDEVYTNNARLISSLRVKQWLDHIKEAEPKWIPVTERLPMKTDCIAFFQNGNWYVCTEDGIQDEYWHKVIAWMELPKPYEEGKNET